MRNCIIYIIISLRSTNTYFYSHTHTTNTAWLSEWDREYIAGWLFLLYFRRDSVFIVVYFVLSKHPRVHQFFLLACSFARSLVTMLHRSFHWTIKIIKMRYYACSIMQRAKKKSKTTNETITRNKSRSTVTRHPLSPSTISHHIAQIKCVRFEASVTHTLIYL